MKHCPNLACELRRQLGVAAEYVDRVPSCTKCGTALAPGAAPPPELEQVDWRDLVVISTTNTGVSAHILRGVLESEDIPVRIIGEALLGAVGEIPVPTADVRVLVPPEHAERARQIALDWESDSLGDPPEA